MNRKITTLGDKIIDACETSNLEINEIVASAQEELARHNAEQNKQEVFDSLNVEIKEEPGTKKWFTKINWNEFDAHQEIIAEKQEEIISLISTGKLADDEAGRYLTKKQNKYIGELSKSAIGRELLNNYEVHIFLQLFIDQKDVIITGKDGDSYAPWLNNKGKSRQKISKYFAAYTAIQGMLKDNLSLNANSYAKQKVIIKDLVKEEISRNQLDRENYDVKSAAKYLNKGESTLRKYLGEGKIQGGKAGRQWIFTKAQLDAFIKQYKTNAEIDTEVEREILKHK